ncbi:MAG: chemotaxis protein CheD [Pelagimonas sp.]|jgi:chemotaxis protein CheD|nr:chemotaxis protein CheD [Pelagimonas sp.]
MISKDQKLVNIIQGSYHISSDETDILTTVLGSCVSVCLYDPVAKVGGMNHFLLPKSASGEDADNVRYGANAMELLINELLKNGATKENLEAKVFGGGKLTGPGKHIGQSNASFTKQFLLEEGIPIRSESLGGTSARRIRFWPTTGLVKQLLVAKVDEDLSRPAPQAPPTSQDDQITLF